MENHPTSWTGADSAAASAEGWDLWECTGSVAPWQLQGFDDDVEWESLHGTPYPFPAAGRDRHAWQHVFRRAAQGSPLHQKALQFLQEHSPPEYENLVAVCRSL